MNVRTDQWELFCSTCGATINENTTNYQMGIANIPISFRKGRIGRAFVAFCNDCTGYEKFLKKSISPSTPVGCGRCGKGVKIAGCAVMQSCKIEGILDVYWVLCPGCAAFCEIENLEKRAGVSRRVKRYLTRKPIEIPRFKHVVYKTGMQYPTVRMSFYVPSEAKRVTKQKTGFLVGKFEFRGKDDTISFVFYVHVDNDCFDDKGEADAFGDFVKDRFNDQIIVHGKAGLHVDGDDRNGNIKWTGTGEP